MNTSMTMLSEEDEDPLQEFMRKQQKEREIYKQFKIACLKAKGIDNLPSQWKSLSPLNRLKQKIKVDKCLQRYEE